MLTHHALPAWDALLRVVAAAGRRLRPQAGQGTIEYVGLMLLMSVVLAAVVKAAGATGDYDLAKKIVDEVKGAIDGVGGTSGKG